ncbi:MAG: hypothetical protein NVS3B10_26220 [Polyangiales bacterium]
MLRRRSLFRVPLLFAGFTLLGCGTSAPADVPTADSGGPSIDGASDGTSDAGRDGDGEAGAPASPFLLPCTDSLADVYTAPASLPPYDASRRGEVVRCAFDRKVSAAEIDALATKFAFTTTTKATSGATMWRIAYRTERLAGTGALGTAAVMLPDAPPPATPPPLVLFAHGTVGAGTACVVSKLPLGNDDEVAYDLALVGRGLPMVIPDYAGTEFGQPPPGYLLSEDEAHSLLDGTRAMRKLLPSTALADAVVGIGHSQGGHSILSAQPYAKTYGLGGKLAGVLAFAPPWFVAKSYGAILSPLAGFDTATAPYPLAYMSFYFWTHGEVYDGPGGGLKPFRADKRDLVQKIFANDCDLGPQMPTLGKTPSDFFEPAFVDAVGNCAITDSGCDVEPAKTWAARFKADRPPVDPAGASMVIWEGGKDTAVTPDRVACGVETITAQLKAATPAATATLTACGDKDADHAGVITNGVDWTMRWVAAVVKGDKAPACPGFDAIGAPKCATPPTNTD